MCEATHLTGTLIRLLRESRRFHLIRCTLLDFIFSFTQEEELEFYRQQNETSIYYRIFDLFRRKPWTVTENLMTVASEINIPTQKNIRKGPDRDFPAYKYVRGSLSKTHRQQGISGRIHPNPDKGGAPFVQEQPRKEYQKTYSMELCYNRLLLISPVAVQPP